MIRNEVKAALYKVSSSVDLGQNHNIVSRQSLIKHIYNESTSYGADENITADFGQVVFEEKKGSNLEEH